MIRLSDYFNKLIHSILRIKNIVKVKKLISINAILLAIIIFIISCNKENKPPIGYGEIWDCHHEMVWDSLSTKSALIGEWAWEYIACFDDPENANYSTYDGMEIIFRQDNTLDVMVDGQITQTSKWKIINGDADLFAIEVDSAIAQLHGRILFCRDIVEFNNSYIDGCDNYFKRKI